MIIAKLTTDNLLESTWMDDQDPLLPAWLDNGWKPLTAAAALVEPGTFERVDYEYTETDDDIRQLAVIHPDYPAEIAWNKKQLVDLDWKTTRNTIAERAGMPLPIPWETLYSQTQAYRDRINELEQQPAQE